MSGSPPQMLTTGVPASSTDIKHSSTLSFSLMESSYSRMRPQPVQVRLHACSGSSMSTSGNRFVRASFLRRMYPAIESVMPRGKGMGVVSGLFVGLVAHHRFGRRVRRYQIPADRHEREVERVVVVLQVEDLGEPGAGERVLVPGAVVALRPQEPLDAGPGRGTAG